MQCVNEKGVNPVLYVNFGFAVAFVVSEKTQITLLLSQVTGLVWLNGECTVDIQKRKKKGETSYNLKFCRREIMCQVL